MLPRELQAVVHSCSNHTTYLSEEVFLVAVLVGLNVHVVVHICSKHIVYTPEEVLELLASSGVLFQLISFALQQRAHADCCSIQDSMLVMQARASSTASLCSAFAYAISIVAVCSLFASVHCWWG